MKTLLLLLQALLAMVIMVIVLVEASLLLLKLRNKPLVLGMFLLPLIAVPM